MHHADGRRKRRAGADANSGHEQPVALFGIYAIADPAVCGDPEAFVDAVLRGGVRLIQYRAKAKLDRDVVRRLHRRTSREGALLIVNDDLDAAADADGVHLGQEDLAALGTADIRGCLPGKVLGISCGVPAEAEAAERLHADYVGVGPFARTSSKDDAGPAIGALGVARVVRAVPRLPVAAIGGIHGDNLGDVAATGAQMAAVLSALSHSGDPEAAARDLVRRWAHARA